MSGHAAFDLAQPAILAPVAATGLGLVFDLARGVDPRPGLIALGSEPGDGAVAIGIGAPLALTLGARVDGLQGFPGVSGVGVSFPSTQGALWVFVRGEARGDVLDRAQAITRALGEGWILREEVDTFRYREGRDLTGYVDGTENPTGDAAAEAALVGGGASGGDGVVGASFVAVQRFVHALARFEAFDAAARDAMVGRRADTNEEIEDAVVTAHVKRTAQESFEPPAFMVRRSMPWGGLRESGLYFVAYVASLDNFGRMLDRMAGLEDGAVDGLLTVTRAVSGGYYFCPPMRGGALDLRALGL